MTSHLPKLRLPSAQTIKARCTSIDAWALPKETNSIAPDYVRSNKDMEPVPPEQQTWTLWTWMAYWATDLVNLGTWETASSIIAVGLTWRDAIPIMVAGCFCVAIPMVLNGAIGAHLHVPFSVVVRSSFGYYFGYFCIISRAILAMFWLGIQGANGAQAMTCMIAAIWPSYFQYDYGGPKNTLSVSGGISTMGMISYFLYWLIQLPLLLIPPTRLKYLFVVKLIFAPITAIAMMGWCIHKAGGGGELLNLAPTVSGSTRVWLWLNCMSAVTGVWAPLTINVMDFSRYAKSSRGQYVQLPLIPILFTLLGTVGIMTTSASYVIYGTYMWNPLDIVEQWIKHGGSGGRAAAFFAAFSWYVAQVGTNITANSISAANDLTVLFPRYVNIRRGCIIAAIIGGWVIVPWKIISSAETFLAFMGGYSVFLAPMAGIIAADYWLVKRRRIDVPALYDPYGRYRYLYGINWQAMVAFILAAGPTLPGLALSIGGPGKVHISPGARNLYDFDWIYGFVTGIFVYTVLHWIFPWKAALVPQTIDGVEIMLEGRPAVVSDREGYKRHDKNPDHEKGFGNVDAVNPAQDF